MNGPRIGSLFSGYGGLDLGVQAALGGEVAWHVEYDDAPSRILEHHYPGLPNYGDITKVKWTPDCPACGEPTAFYTNASVAPAREEYYCPTDGWFDVSIRFDDPNADRIPDPNVDVLTGGFPCQDLSLAGRRAGMRTGTRSGLWADYLRGIAALRPSLVVIENVRGLLSGCAESEADSHLGPCPRCADPEARAGHAPNLRALGRVFLDLARIGYVGSWIGLRAADAGAPHGRYRIFVLAHPSDGPALGEWPRARSWVERASDAERVELARERLQIRRIAAVAGSGGRTDADTDGTGLRRIRRLKAVSPDADGRDGARGDGHPNQPEASAEDADISTGGERGVAASGQAKGGRAWPDARGRGGASATDSRRVRRSQSTESREGAGATRRAPEGTETVGAHHSGGRPVADPSGVRGDEGRDAELVGEDRPTLVVERSAGSRLAADTSGDESERRRVPGDVGGAAAEVQETRQERERLRDATRDRRATSPRWGIYGPAIERWEHALGRVAPAPTEITDSWFRMVERRRAGLDPRPVGHRGSLAVRHSLSAAFVEWMMGLAEGWVTSPEIGLSRNEMLKALGNGVVRQQAEIAVRTLLGLEMERAA